MLRSRDAVFMTEQLISELPLLQRLALAYAPRSMKDQWLSLLALDARLGGVVRQTHEPMLGQIRLAWWRDVLDKAKQDRPSGDPLVDLLGSWRGEERALISLVDAWETLLTCETLAAKQVGDYAEARAIAYSTMARISGAAECEVAAMKAAEAWVLADLVSGLSEESEKACALAVASKVEGASALPVRSLRPLAVLGGLGARALRREGGAVLKRPSDLLAVLRLGILGR